MAFSLNFDQKLKDTLNDIAHKYIWETNWSADTSSRVDVVGLIGKLPYVLIEVELKKDNPVENVVKIWRWGKNSKNTRHMLLIQAFSALYSNPRNKKLSTPKHKQYERSKFIGGLLSEDSHLNIEYREIPIYSTTRKGVRIPYTPRLRRGFVAKKGGASMHRAAYELAKDIVVLLNSIPQA